MTSVVVNSVLSRTFIAKISIHFMGGFQIMPLMNDQRALRKFFKGEIRMYVPQVFEKSLVSSPPGRQKRAGCINHLSDFLIGVR